MDDHPLRHAGRRPAWRNPATRAAIAIALAATLNASGGAAESAGTPGPAARPRVLVRTTTLGEHFGQLALYGGGNSHELRYVDGINCEVAYAAGGKGICLNAERRILGDFAATLFDANSHAVLGKIPIQGLPSRARVSPDGGLAAYTVFTTGHGYESVDFTTDTKIVDIGARKILADLEEFAVTRDGKAYKNRDFNFWGVTFTPDSKSFYATLSSERQHLLVKGDIAARTARVVHVNVECPSLSPDGTHVAFKRRTMTGRMVAWSLHVLDLASGKETRLAEERSIDDQLEWLDGGHVLYAIPESAGKPSPVTNLWSIATDGSGKAELFLQGASSPSTQR